MRVKVVQFMNVSAFVERESKGGVSAEGEGVCYKDPTASSTSNKANVNDGWKKEY